VRWNMCVYALSCARKSSIKKKYMCVMYVCVETRAVCAEKEMYVCVETRAVCAEKEMYVCVCIYVRCVREGNVYLRAVCAERSMRKEEEEEEEKKKWFEASEVLCGAVCAVEKDVVQSKDVRECVHV